VTPPQQVRDEMPTDKPARPGHDDEVIGIAHDAIYQRFGRSWIKTDAPSRIAVIVTPACEGDNPVVTPSRDSLASWTPAQIAQGKRWVQAWKSAGDAMERLRREELRRLDSQAIALLCGPADYHVAPRAPRPTSGLIEQQRWFMKARRD
jgi:hypothetical protein